MCARRQEVRRALIEAHARIGHTRGFGATQRVSPDATPLFFVRETAHERALRAADVRHHGAGRCRMQSSADMVEHETHRRGHEDQVRTRGGLLQ